MFSAYSKNTDKWFHAGKNLKTKKDCIKKVVPYLLCDRENEDWSKIPGEKIINFFNIGIKEHSKPVQMGDV